MKAGLASLLQLLQLSDSALPIGGYSNSWGLETWVQHGQIKTAREVVEALRSLLLSSIAPNDGIACVLAHRFAGNDDDRAFVLLNEYLTAGRWSKEPLEASLRMGERLKQLALKIRWLQAVPSGRTHHCAMFGWLAGKAQIDREECVSAYLYSSMASLVSACVRLVPLGHTDGQLILSGLQTGIINIVPDLLNKGLDDLGGFAPMNEWACKQHETLYSRLFQS